MIVGLQLHFVGELCRLSGEEVAGNDNGGLKGRFEERFKGIKNYYKLNLAIV